MASFELSILVVDDEAELRRSLRLFLEKQGAHVTEAENGKKAVDALAAADFDIILMDVRMPEIDGLSALKFIGQNHPSVMVIIVTAHANINDAKTAIRDGAFDYLEKPLREEDILRLMEKVRQSRGLAEQAAFSAPILNMQSGERIVGQSGQMRQIFELINRLAQVDTSVLIRGENGTGKELVAKAIHFNSPRKDRPFVAVNCAAIPETLIESEFFGHEKGAFTGADSRKIGKFQFATGGTLFLDEIGDISPAVQAKLLRVLQEKVFTPVGSNREVKADVRILAATNRPLEDYIKLGRFREDLYYRLNVMPIFLPPLRERTQDIDLLAEHFIRYFNRKHGKTIKGLSDGALKLLRGYQWPGNIRELENAIEYAFIVEHKNMIQAESLPPLVRGVSSESQRLLTAHSATDYKATKEGFEREFIIQALRANKGRINQTSEKAGIPKNTLLRKIKKYGITSDEYEDE